MLKSFRLMKEKKIIAGALIGTLMMIAVLLSGCVQQKEISSPLGPEDNSLQEPAQLKEQNEKIVLSLFPSLRKISRTISRIR